MAPSSTSPETQVPTWRDPWVRALVVLAIALQAFAWSSMEGYQIADAVEFMERAQAFARGERVLDSAAIRPFGFPFALAPFFVLADWLSIEDQRAIPWCIALLQCGLAIVLLVRCVRIGAIVGGRSAGLAAGFLCAANPVLLQYAPQPISDIAAGVCIAFAIELVLERANLRRALASGVWFALAFMIAYKTLVVVLAIAALLMLRDRWKHGASWRGVLWGLAIGLLAQATIDLLLYGRFGASIGNYVAQNASSVATSIFLRLHWLLHPEDDPIKPTIESFALSTAHWFYDTGMRLRGTTWLGPTDISLRGKQDRWFYVTELPTMLVWPAILLLVCGVVRAITRPRWTTSLLVLAFLACVAAMSNKGSKEFRLWLPLLPLLLPICGLGWAFVADLLLSGARATRAVVATGGAIAVIVLGARAFGTLNLREFNGYWKAADYVNELARSRAAEARASGGFEPLRVGCAYHWAVYLRFSPLVAAEKLPSQLNMWRQFEPAEDGFVREHLAALDELDEYDVFLVHLPILTSSTELLGWINTHYQVDAAFYDQETYEDLGPIFVLVRRDGSADARTFFDVEREPVDDTLPASLAPPRTDFISEERDEHGAPRERLQLVSVDFETIGPQGLGWITYRWRALTPLARDYTFLDRVTAFDERNAWENNHLPAYGAYPTSRWTPGEVLRESYLLVPSARPYARGEPFRPVGGGYRRGDLVPVRAWMRVKELEAEPPAGAEPVVKSELLPARVGESTPIRTAAESERYDMPDGAQFSVDGAVRIGAFWLPVLDEARLPDDGKPVPD